KSNLPSQNCKNPPNQIKKTNRFPFSPSPKLQKKMSSHLRRKCTPECVFAPYFPPDQPAKFASVHLVFGASNVAKLLNEIPAAQRDDAVNSLAYEAEARLNDSGLRLRRLHHQAPAPPQAAPIGPPPRPAGARQVHRPSRPASFIRFCRPK
ncbi:unnamed protein product, partial [Linum tenue]